MSRTAYAWGTPDQMTALHATATQMMYRFTDAATYVMFLIVFHASASAL